MRIAECRDEFCGIPIIAPEKGGVVARSGNMGVAACEITRAIPAVRIQRIVGRIVTPVRFHERIGTTENAFQLVRAGPPIERELHAFVKKGICILRVQHPATAVLGRAIECADQPAIARPHGNATRKIICLRHPQPALRIERKAIWIVHMARIILA